MFSVTKKPKGSTSYDGVHAKLISTIFCPGLFNSRAIYHGITKTNLISGSALYTLTTNNAGNAYMDICPGLILNTAIDSLKAFIVTYNDATLVLNTGI